MKACHTGYRKASGWYLPVGKLASKGIIDFSDYAEEAANHSPPVRVDAETVEQFWDDNVCAPGTTANGPTVAGNLYGVVDGGGLCKLCKTDCTSSDPYAGYEGALSCMDQEGDIAFVKHSTVRNYDASDSEDDDSDDDDDGDDDDGDDDGDDDDGDDDGDDDDGDDDDGDDGSDRPPLTESDKRGGDGGSPSPSPPTSQSPSPSSSPSPFPLPSSPDATSSANVAYLMTLLGNPELTDSLKLEIQGDVVKEAKRACNAAGKSCPDASFTGAVECTADCGAVRRRLLASEAEVFGTLNNVAGGKAFEDYMSSLPEIGGRPVSGSSNFVAVGDASMVKMGLGGCMVLVLGLLLAMA
ncbi:hypothetical protein DUNSADRAFT_8246 [Dunaliella salina]|uniref:Transferrin-like domain-containing protein n=1 Tax=Dunaliella salina TaxID=3046 RepID=A0ABQ7HA54_DUNSA|nr:hypothetical protein DUNSADRAFT_8246 [Dunaliella salina]|eukprot:KAF5843731.1 hypothetical protein DUNSADRAFT_8246 [Dunaliella salina]